MARFSYSLACSNKFDVKRCPNLCPFHRYTMCRYRTNISGLLSQEGELTFSKKPAQEGYVYRPKSLWVLTTGTNEAHNWSRLFIPILTIYSMMSPLEFDFWRFFPICHRTKSQEGEAPDTSSSHTSAAYEWNRPFNAGMYGATCKNVHAMFTLNADWLEIRGNSQGALDRVRAIFSQKSDILCSTKMLAIPSFFNRELQIRPFWNVRKLCFLSI